MDKAIGSLVDSHVQLAGIQGFLTNIGGLVALTVTVPANISGLALLQCHMVGGIAHLRGYDLDDPRVRNAVFACMLGGDTVQHLVKRKKIPSSPDGDRDRAHLRPDISTTGSPPRSPTSCWPGSPASARSRRWAARSRSSAVASAR